MRILKKTLVLIVMLISNFVIGQNACFRIESILVDACGNPEGPNEMMRIKIGASNLSFDDLTVTWPNNPYRGICQNITTASRVHQMNNTVTSCGLFLEPTEGVLPANSNVLLITSTDFDPFAHNYAGLSDTIYVIFQCPGNVSGHFANWVPNCDLSSGNRTTSVSFGSGCFQSVTYNRCLLINQNGSIGGTSAERDGARVDFSINGSQSYANDGCTIPYEPLEVQIDSIDAVFCSNNDLIALSSSISGVYSSLLWQSDLGTFTDENATETSFIPNTQGNSNGWIKLIGTNGCGEEVIDSLAIELIQTPEIISLTENQISSGCGAGSVALNVETNDDFVWSTGDTSQMIFPAESGWYSVEVQNSCGLVNDSMFVNMDGDLAYSISFAESVCINAINEYFSLNISGGSGDYTVAFRLNGTYFEQEFSGNNLNIPVATNQSGIVVLELVSIIDNDSACEKVFNELHEITIYPLPTWDVTVPETFCEQQDVTVEIKINNGLPPYQISYNVNATNHSITTDSSGLAVITVSSEDVQGESIDIDLISVNSTLLDCGDDIDETFTVVKLAAPVIMASADTSVCIDSDAFYVHYFSETISENFEINYLVNGGAQFNSVMQSDTLVSVLIEPYQIGAQSVNLIVIEDNSLGCSFNFDLGIVIDVQPLPVVDFLFTPEKINEDYPLVQFSNLTEGATEYSWDFGDNQSSSNLISPTHIFNQNINNAFNVTLSAKSDIGCENRLTKQIEFDMANLVFIPNAFSPDGNEHNPTFYPVLSSPEKIQEYNFQVFSRWGELLFTTSDVSSVWDGTYKGVLCPSGTYVWKLVIEYSESQNAISYNGHVTLLR